ncbi:MAG: twin-arginine translocase subunit TatB [Phenylobacterium sp.]|uniref:Sec-independent protein translocase protein TatB n=1 Tax=Phenylobacterium sp. TaxID=1871053 RepID=UPI0008CCD8F4|nr:Sec-independent protein translocase protein TatB [Phenylobacterium sp.]MBA4795670.1 twin-arginine translocase subunit TatB [Phenylobacterium sp.]OHB36673.1 MAG: twin arginine-targeting protein translocase TatB [Phenylobacterium sp. RIFCSPHIGHO2_01_FULL_70_10]
MLPDIGAGELLLIGIVALVVVGPKDLPVLMRRLGQFTARLRGMAAEFRASFDEMGRQSELDDLRREVEALRSGRLADEQLGRTDAQAVMREIESGLARGDMQVSPAAHPYAGTQSLSEPEPSAAPDAAPAPEPAAGPEPAAKAKAPAKAKTADAPGTKAKAARRSAKAPSDGADKPKSPRARRKPAEGQA